MKRLFAAFAAAALVLAAGNASAQFTPGNMECIAPSDPGGGWDFTCRQMAPLLTELGFVSGNIRAQNMSGAGGAIAFAHVVNNHNDNENLLVAASTATTSRIAAGEFGDFSVDDVRWPAALGADDGVLAVAADSPINSLADLVEAWEDNPRSVSIVGGSSAGGWDHLKVLLIADAADVPVNDVRYTSFSSGNVAIVEILAGRADVFTGDLSEALPHFEAGTLKGIALLSDSRLELDATADIQTGKEQGFDIVAPNWRGFYLPAGISDEAYDFWVDAFETIADSDEWADLREKNGIGDFRRFGTEMEEFARKQVADIQKLLEEIGAE